MNMLACIPLSCTSWAQAQQAVAVIGTKAYIELYLDFIPSAELQNNVEELIALCAKHEKIIITLRRPRFASQLLSAEIRKQIVNHLVGTAALFDFDINHEQAEITELLAYPQGQTKLIASYHNYEKTPEESELITILSELQKYNPRVIKFASTVIGEEDYQRCLQLALSLRASAHRSWIISPMGESHGVSGRMVTALLGSAWTYVQPPVELRLSGTAIGQLTFEEFQTLQSLCRN